MTPAAHSGAKDNVRLLLIKNSARAFSGPGARYTVLV